MNGFGPVVPAHSVRWFAAGEHCDDASAGDLLLVDHGTIPDLLIGFGERVAGLFDRTLKPFAWCRHTAFVRPNGVVSEMGFKGHELRFLDEYAARLYAVVHFDAATPEQILASLAADDSLHGTEYGWASYPPLVLDCLTGARFGAAWGSTMICSTHVTMVAMPLGLFPDRQPGGTMPVHVAHWLGASPPA